jgi:DNA-binding PadR family transcriptional regulator
MSAKHAVLGLVIEKPGYGYELAQRLEERCGAWAWQPAGVYEALNLLLRDEHVQSIGRRGSSTTGRAAPRTIYESTPQGLDYHAAWLFGSSPLRPVRQELDLKMLFARPESLLRLIEQTKAQEQQCVDEIATLTSSTPAEPNAPPRWPESSVILQRDLQMDLLEVRLKYLQKARGVMKEALGFSGGVQAA